MENNLWAQIANYLFKSHDNDQLFGESRFVYFAESKDTDEPEQGVEGEEDETETLEKPEKPAKPEATELAEEDIHKEVASPMTSAREGTMSVLDQMEYNLPADIDPQRIKDARKIVDEQAGLAESERAKYDNLVNSFIESMGLTAPLTAEQKEDVELTIYKAIKDISRENMNQYKEYETATGGSDLPVKIADQLKVAWKKYSPKPFKLEAINDHAHRMTPVFDKLSEYEFEILKTMNDVKEVLWDVYEKGKEKKIEERLIRGAERATGLKLARHQEFTGKRTRITGWNPDHTPISKEIKDRWSIVDVYVNKEKDIYVDETKKDDDPETIMQLGLWVDFLSEKDGKIHRISSARLKEFVDTNRLESKIKKKNTFKAHVPHLKEMGISIAAGQVLEFDDWILDEKSQRLKPQPTKVKIKFIDDNEVVLHQPITLGSPYDSSDPSTFERKDKLTLPEFTKWLNRTRAVPTMNLNSLQSKLDEHYELMNAKYNRNENCHEKIELKPDEIIFADAPGNPLFKINRVNTSTGKIELLKNGTTYDFTGPQFLKWVYENDIEPYKPELEAEKVKRYMKGNDEEAGRAEEDAEKVKNLFETQGIWRNTKKYINDKIGAGEDPTFNLKEDQKNILMKQSHSHLRQFLNDSTLLNLDDIWQLLKSGHEYYTRNWRRRQKGRYSAIGKGIPWFSTEFERVNQEAENEEMNQFKQAMEQWGVRQIEETLYSTNNRDQAKACLEVLSSKGQLRWDERRLWKTINKFTDISHKIPLPVAGMDPYIPFGEDTKDTFMGMPVAGKSAVDFLPEAIDSLWGESTHIGWKRQNDSSIEDGITKSYNKAEELESDPKNSGGISKELAVLMEKHMNGEYVDPTEFEGMLRFIIEMGKATGTDKVYYLLMGTSAKNPQGRTIMGWDRVGRFISKYSNAFPAIDYFSSSNLDPKRDPVTGEIFTRAFVRSDFDNIVAPWIGDFNSTRKIVPPVAAEDYLWKEMLTSEGFQRRLEKGIRNAGAIDHDDSPYFIPALKDSEVESACASSGGETKKFTVQGYKNAYVGFGLRLKTLQDKYDVEEDYENKGEVGFKGQYLQKMVGTFQSYMKYDGILDNRYRRSESTRLQRFSGHDYKTGCVWDGERPIEIYQDEMRDLIKEIANKYGEGKNKDIVERPFIRLASVKGKPELEAEQKKIEHAIENFGTTFEEMVMKDKGAAMIEIINKHKFKADERATDPEEKARNKMKLGLMEGLRSDEAATETISAGPGLEGEEAPIDPTAPVA